MIPEIMEWFPDAGFIHLVRDGRAVAWSYAKKQLQKIKEYPEVYQAHGYDLGVNALVEKFSAHWKQHILEIEKCKKTLQINAENLIEIKYEEFCKEPQKTFKKILEFMSLEYEDSLDSEINKIKNMNYKYQTEMPPEEILKIQKIMTPILQQKGYAEITDVENAEIND